MENCPFIDDFPIKTSIYEGFSMAMLNNQMVSLCLHPENCTTGTCLEPGPKDAPEIQMSSMSPGSMYRGQLSLQERLQQPKQCLERSRETTKVGMQHDATSIENGDLSNLTIKENRNLPHQI